MDVPRDMSIVAVQEHWLNDDNLYQLNNIHPEFTGYGISAMTKSYQLLVIGADPLVGSASCGASP